MPYDFDPNATPLPRIQALEDAVRDLSGGGTDGEANAALDKRLTNIENALELNAAASKDLDQRQKDLDQRHRDLYAMVTAMQDRLGSTPTAPAPKTTAAKSAA